VGEVGFPRRSVAVLAADVVGYAGLMEADEVGTVTRFGALRAGILEPMVLARGGAVAGIAGDCLVAVFERGGAAEADCAEVAVDCAVGLQEALARWEPHLGEAQRMRLRVGVHAGDVLFHAGAFHGDGINVAARVQALAEPGGVLVTDEVHRRLKTRQRGRFSASGPQPRKNIARLVTVWHWHPDGRDRAAAAPAPTKPTVAVLPFRNLSAEPRWGRLCDGLCEDLLTDLSRHPDLLVIARASSSAYRDRRRLHPSEIGRALGARYLLYGSVQADAGHVCTTARLVGAASGAIVWADRYSRAEADLFAIQEEVVKQVVPAIAGFEGTILRAERMHARRRPPASLRAYEHYLLGYEQESRLDQEGTLRAIEHLEEAVQADPLFSRAWTVLGWAWGNAASNGWKEDVADARKQQRKAVLRAAELDPGDGLVQQALGLLLAREGNVPGARDAFEKSLRASANHPDALALLAKHVAEALGRPGEAAMLMERAFTLNPHAPSWYFFGQVRVAYFARRFELALDAAARAPQWRTVRLFRILALAQLGRAAEAAAAASEFRAAHPAFRAAEMAASLPLLCPRVREFFFDGVRKVRLDAPEPAEVRALADAAR
jgi:TolB-like protein/class 3 adenylate cyclase/Tfp pilus assembly protein PilF